MSKLVKISALSVILAAFGANAADLGSGEINFKGTVVDAPCGITVDTATQTVDFGQISKSVLSSGSTSVQKPLEIKLTQCDAATLAKGVQVTFSGNTSSAAGEGGTSTPVLNELVTAGPTNTAIVINNGSDVQFGNATDFMKLTAGDNTLRFQTWVKQATGKTVAAGDFNAVANFQLNYQ